MLADSAVELDAARLLVYRTAWAADEGRDVRTDAFKAKLYATEMAQRVTDRCLQVFGGRGYAQATRRSRASSARSGCGGSATAPPRSTAG